MSYSCEKCIHEKVCQRKSLKNISECNDFLNSDKIMALPCALNSSVYRTAYDGTVQEYKVVGFSADENGVWLITLIIEHKNDIYNSNIETTEIGKTAFFSKEELLNSKRKD